MSRFNKLSHVLWHCQYHIVWVPKYRYRVLTGKVGFGVSKTIRVYAERLISVFKGEAILRGIIFGRKVIAWIR